MPLSYRGKARKLLEEAGAEDYSTLLIEKGGVTFKGLLIPRARLQDDEHIVLKLDSGYNIGVSIERIDELVVMGGPRRRARLEPEKSVGRSDLPDVPIIVTGGTITSKVDYITGAVRPYERPEELLDLIPEISEIANISYVPLMTMLSEDLTPRHWLSIAEEVARRLNSGATGAVIAHGTDTMHFTASALSFMLRNLSKPVALVGAQRSIDRPSTDAVLNLFSAVKMAAEGPAGEVMIVMHGGPSDDFSYAIRGVRARKMHTSRRDAFLSVNQPPLAKITRSDIEMLNSSYRRRDNGCEVEVLERIEKVALVYSWPTMEAEIFDSLVEDGYLGFVVAGTGLGHLPQRVIPKIRELTSRGIPVIATSQCFFGRVNLRVYENGRLLLHAGAIAVEDMLPETALVKLMCIMGQTREMSKIEELMRTNMVGELSESIGVDLFPPGGQR